MSEPDIKVRISPNGTYRLIVDGKVRRRSTNHHNLIRFWRDEHDIEEDQEADITVEFQKYQDSFHPFVQDLKPLPRLLLNSMLTYPSMYPDRLPVLGHIYFILGNGYDWRNGMLVENLALKPRRYTMDYSDLDETIPDGLLQRLINQIALTDTLSITEREEQIISIRDVLGKQIEDARIKAVADRISRTEIEKNILTIVNTPDTTGMINNDAYGNPRDILSYIDGGKYNLGGLPDRMEQSFFDGLLEALDAVIRGGHPDAVLPPCRWGIPRKNNLTREEKLDDCARLQEFRDSLPDKIEAFEV
jgi:hypothetical protein